MPKDDGVPLSLFLGDVHYHEIVGVDVDGLEADHHFFDASVKVPQHVDVSVSDVQLVLPLNQELLRERV